MSNSSRGRKVVKNTMAALRYEVVALVCGLILPRLILATFGSSYNGITSSITQFLSCIALLNAGIGGVTQAALYKPLSIGDRKEVSGIIKATESFMKKVAALFAIIILFFAVIYPFFVKEDFSWLFSASMVLILGISTFAQYYFGITYQILLTADQRQDIIYNIQIITTIANTIIAAVLIKIGCSIHVVKLGSALVFCLNPLLTNIYVHKNYELKDDVVPNNKAIGQRWDAFAHEIANFVNSNTDIIVLTVFSNVRVISVYTVYYMVINNISKLLKNTMGGIRAAFGNMLAKEQYNALNENLRALELYVFVLSDVLFIVTGVMIVPFVMVYTSGVTDVEYNQLTFAVISTVAAYFSCIRLPYVNIVQAAGHFRQTRNGAIFEAVINIIVSVVLVYHYGLVGVSIGTLVAAIFRTIQYAVYASKVICHRSISVFVKHIISSVVSCLLIIVFSTFFLDYSYNNYLQWALGAFIVALVTVLSVLLMNLLLFKEDMGLVLKKVMHSLKKR